MFVLDTVKEDPKQKLLIAGSNAEEKSNCAVEVENCKGSSPKKIIEKFVSWRRFLICEEKPCQLIGILALML